MTCRGGAVRSLSFFLLLIVPVAPCLGEEPPEKKLIEWDWDEPDTTFLRENIRKMEEYPFDGLVFHVNSSRGGNLTWEMCGSTRNSLDGGPMSVCLSNTSRPSAMLD